MHVLITADTVGGVWTYTRELVAGLVGASLVVAPSRWMLEQIESCYGRPKSSRVIYNGRSPELFDGLCPKRQYAASAGRLWDEGKQSRLLTELLNPPLPIVVAGALELEDEAEPELPESGELEAGARPRV